MSSESDEAGSALPEDDRLREGIFAFLIGAGGYVGIQLVAIVLVVSVATAVGTLSEMEANVVAAVGTGVGAVVVTAVYLENSRHGFTFLDLDLPGLRDVGYVIGGVVVLVGVLIGVSTLANAFGVGLTDHSLAGTAEDADPMVVLLLVPVSFLFVGPGEELVFRNVVQKRLAESFSTAGAIGLASVAFAAIHFPAYATGALPQILTSLVAVFALSMILGWLYARTEKLVVPALVHGLYNGVQFTVLYFEVSGSSPF